MDLGARMSCAIQVGVGTVDGGLSRVRSPCPQILNCSNLDSQLLHKPGINNTGCNRAGDNLLLNAQYYHHQNLLKGAMLLLPYCSEVIVFLQV